MRLLMIFIGGINTVNSQIPFEKILMYYSGTYQKLKTFLILLVHVLENPTLLLMYLF